MKVSYRNEEMTVQRAILVGLILFCAMGLFILIIQNLVDKSTAKANNIVCEGKK